MLIHFSVVHSYFSELQNVFTSATWFTAILSSGHLLTVLNQEKLHRMAAHQPRSFYTDRVRWNALPMKLLPDDMQIPAETALHWYIISTFKAFHYSLKPMRFRLQSVLTGKPLYCLYTRQCCYSCSTIAVCINVTGQRRRRQRPIFILSYTVLTSGALG